MGFQMYRLLALCLVMFFLCGTLQASECWVPRDGNRCYLGTTWNHRETVRTPPKGVLTSNEIWGCLGGYEHLYPGNIYFSAMGEWHTGHYKGAKAFNGVRTKHSVYYIEADLGYTMRITRNLRWMATPFIGYRYEHVHAVTQNTHRDLRHYKNYIPLGFRLDWLMALHWNLAFRGDVLFLVHGWSFVSDPVTGSSKSQVRTNYAYEACLPITWFLHPKGEGLQIQLVPKCSYRSCARKSAIQSEGAHFHHILWGIDLDIGYGF